MSSVPNSEIRKRVYFENLDGLRFLCFLSVFFFHSYYTESESIQKGQVYQFVKFSLFSNGNLGVNFFFVLSGFLITYLLVEEKQMMGQINVPYFWLRRVLRIWPLFYFCVFFGFVVFPIAKQAFGQVPNETASLISYLTFTNNFDFLAKGSPDSSVLGVLWSIAVEEQFYLLWPIIVFLTPVRRLWIPFIIIVGGSLIFRAITDDPMLNEYHTLSCIGDMAVGAGAAWLILVSEHFKNIISGLSKGAIASIYLAIFLGFFFREDIFGSHYSIRIFERALIAVIFSLIILEQSFSINSFFKMSRFRTMSALGTITYGLYCLHFIAILVVTNLAKQFDVNQHVWQVLIADTIFSLLLAIVIAELSYRFYESPFLLLKKKFEYITK